MHHTLKTILALLAALGMAACATRPSRPAESPPLDEDCRTVMPMGPLFMPMR
jgi:hypothetical protein